MLVKEMKRLRTFYIRHKLSSCSLNWSTSIGTDQSSTLRVGQLNLHYH